MDRGLWDPRSNLPSGKEISFKFAVDAANQPTLAASPANIFVSSVVRTSQGVYTVTLADTFKSHVRTNVALNVNGTGVARMAQPGALSNVGTSTPVSFQVLIVDNAGAVQDPPAANANNFVAGVIAFADISAV